MRVNHVKYKRHETICPLCVKKTKDRVCPKCGASFKSFTAKAVVPASKFRLVLPTIREMLPNNIGKDQRK